MTETGDNFAGKTKAALIDPEKLEVVWANEAAAGSLGATGGDGERIPLEQAIPLPRDVGVAEALAAVAADGATRRLEASLVSSGRGRLLIVTSIHRLPDGMLLALTENTFQVQERGESVARRPGRRR